MTLPWYERLMMFSIHPEAATLEDIARMATDNADLLAALEDIVRGPLQESDFTVYATHRARAAIAAARKDGT